MYLPIDLTIKYILFLNFLSMIFIVVVKGGPLKQNYAYKVVWHTSACCVMSILIIINSTIKN